MPETAGGEGGGVRIQNQSVGGVPQRLGPGVPCQAGARGFPSSSPPPAPAPDPLNGADLVPLRPRSSETTTSRAENVARIGRHAQELGVELNTEAFEAPESRRACALRALHSVESLAEELGIQGRLHLWPDKALGSKAVMKSVADGDGHRAWLERWWSRVSEWPDEASAGAERVPRRSR
jgi:hypothetical protein